MANYHSDEWVMDRLQEHYEDVLSQYPEDRIVGIFVCGSTNYNIDIKSSDIDSKVILLPSWNEIVKANVPISRTRIRPNDDHIDLKDIRLMFDMFKKQNINFLEILFTKYRILNPRYAKFWERIEANRELIARYNPYQALTTMRGMAYSKYKLMKACSDDPSACYKQVAHIVRLRDFIYRYDKGVSYVECLVPSNIDYIIDIRTGKYDLATVKIIANRMLDDIDELYAIKTITGSNSDVENIMNDVISDILKNYFNNYFEQCSIYTSSI